VEEMKKQRIRSGSAVLALSLILAACGSSSPSSTPTSSQSDAPTYLITPAPGTSVTAPARNTIFPCGHIFSALSAGTAPWVVGNKVVLSKVQAVPGNIKMKSVFHVTETETSRMFTGNGIPSTPVGTFPIPSNSAAYKYYAALPAPGYANAAEIPIQPYDLNVTVPLHPVANATPTCVSMLPSGITLTGATWHIEMAPDSNNNFYSPDSVLPLDTCQGHPYMGQYHYHGYSWKCFPESLVGKPGTQSPLMGYAIDGFGVYGPRDANGKWITNTQLDECHGTTSKVWFNGRYQSIYHYVLNNEYPYSIGCFRGTPAQLPSYMITGNPPAKSSTSGTTTTTMAGM
jgi:hypothetical protein